MAEVTRSQTKKLTQKVSPINLLASIAVLSVVIALAAIFALANWAEASVLSHGVQHVLIFLAGLGFGTSMLAIYHRKGDNNEG